MLVRKREDSSLLIPCLSLFIDSGYLYYRLPPSIRPLLVIPFFPTNIQHGQQHGQVSCLACHRLTCIGYLSCLLLLRPTWHASITCLSANDLTWPDLLPLPDLLLWPSPPILIWPDKAAEHEEGVDKCEESTRGWRKLTNQRRITKRIRNFEHWW